LKLWRKL